MRRGQGAREPCGQEKLCVSRVVFVAPTDWIVISKSKKLGGTVMIQIIDVPGTLYKCTNRTMGYDIDQIVSSNAQTAETKAYI